MSDAAVLLKQLADPWNRGEFVKDVITRIAPLAGLSYWRAWDIWYDKARRVEEGELANIAAAIAKKNNRAVWNAIHKIEADLANLKSIVAGSSEDYGQPTVNSGRGRLRVAGQADRSAAGGGRS